MTFDKNKPAIILDLDNTLICSEEIDDKKFLTKYESKFDKFKSSKFEEYKIFHRPHLQEFLDYIFKHYNVSIWTAASKDYALFIINKILLQNKPERNIDVILFRYHCELSEEHKGTSKKLQMLWNQFKFKDYNRNNTVILDDLDEVYECQTKNCIPAKAFEFKKKNSENDVFLKNLIPKLKKLKKHIMNEGGQPALIVNSKRQRPLRPPSSKLSKLSKLSKKL